MRVRWVAFLAAMFVANCGSSLSNEVQPVSNAERQTYPAAVVVPARFQAELVEDEHFEFRIDKNLTFVLGSDGVWWWSINVQLQSRAGPELRPACVAAVADGSSLLSGL